ncbi:molybdenum cofactor guanylyltransferase [Ferruginibacter lapsinanis]|uniref:molybdenum cofactor guanylyltransferase n=1 Tax=Ferruginibacter lapsinanis TaxID=563172 RepID=UPI001E5E1895|nr:molybdenum cofactor guanylyltransferase [Ferruginibacter lapsinanis]UEG50098.1 molybdenum cofactor guanylyltransferase [Ferruginibacter lapsinanis]
MQDLLGVVLCGGESKRMGSDKGLLSIVDSIWAKYIGDKLEVFNIPVVFSVNETQLQDYGAYIDEDQLVVDSVDVSGPLKGLLSTHKKFPLKNLLLLACDMIDLDEATIDTILQTYQQESRYDFYVYQDAAFAQPFCGIYTAKALQAELARANTHSITKFSLQQLLNEGNTKRLPIANPDAFKNYNEPSGI